ncbi:interleukin-12 subunit beta isoform X1 [Acanthopagrus latus]|uniref:interleukin-12 subunit beta isoform X1 n=1 Tax=Acanthopagrus latus TaxID=8177 RepID=UPI00187CA984|nr:interleukin-12 subunit beta isoform X1 [Acanthopagrus latus]
MGALSLWIFGLLFISLARAHELNHFPENFVVAKRNDPNPVTLTCRSKTDEAVTWKVENEEMEDVKLDDSIRQVGQNLVLTDIDTPKLGQYSCWREQEMLSSTYLLLLEDEEEDESDSPIHCRAKSYDCTFSCKWTDSEYKAVRLGLGENCSSEGDKSCQWISSKEQLQDGGFQFELAHSLSPYAEESTMLIVTAEAISDLSIVRKTKRFYLRDIVQPDSPQIVKCQEVEQDLNVTINPPSSWSSPHSFFRLEHEIEYVLKDNGEHRLSTSALVPKSISMLRVRSRDPLVLSAWSQWTPWKNVRKGKKNPCQCKNKAKSCCPELPSGSLNLCKKRRKKKRSNKAEQNQTS